MKYFQQEMVVVDENNIHTNGFSFISRLFTVCYLGGDVYQQFFLTDIEIEFDLNCIRQECSFFNI
jgi:hypothetical protein